jgi:hypothetical protein
MKTNSVFLFSGDYFEPEETETTASPLCPADQAQGYYGKGRRLL